MSVPETPIGTGHTPGPWRYYDPIGDGHDPVFGPYFQIETGGGRSLTGFISEADARLIVAAPEMLAALHELRIWAGRRGDQDDALIEAADAAIARATGHD